MGDVSSATRKQAAHHEAGHAVVATALGWTVEQSHIYERGHEWWGQTDADGVGLNEHVAIMLGGGAGEARFARTPEDFPRGCRYEWTDAVSLAEKYLSGVEVDAVELLVAEQWDRARRAIRRNIDEWTRFANALLELETLPEERCLYLLAEVRYDEG